MSEGHSHYDRVCPECGKRTGGCRCMAPGKSTIRDAEPCPECRSRCRNTMEPEALREVTMARCARCGESHGALTFRPFTRPPDAAAAGQATHWALCPTLGEPILLAVVARKEEP